MFIWTIGDLIGAVLIGGAILFFLGCWAIVQFDAWRHRRKNSHTHTR